MKNKESMRSVRSLFVVLASALMLVLLPTIFAALTASGARVMNLEIASVASGGAQGDGGSFFVSTSLDGRYVTFMSLSKNLATEPPSNEVNFTDIFLRDRQTDTTYKVSKDKDGLLTNEASLDPTISLDGRYVAYFSYASDIVPNDNNGEEYNRVGLDTFIWDRVSQTNLRVSLDEQGREIKGNSNGTISPDGKYVMFVTNGRVFANDWDADHPDALYLRDWHTGTIERISVAQDGGFPNLGAGMATISRDNRYAVFDSWSSNLAANDTNSEVDVFMYDRHTQTTTLISRGLNGHSANGRSVQSEISLDGSTITFASSASNLVPGDNNGTTDVFVYDTATGVISLASKNEDGVQGNGMSNEPSVCDGGRFISYTTEATNLFDNDTNNRRDVVLFDRITGTNIVATMNWEGALGNAKAHRSFMVPDCRSVAFASDATNLVPGDTNNNRDIFIGEVYLPPADFSASNVLARGSAQPGEIITYTFDVRNIGYFSATAVLVSQIPSNTTFLPGSESAGAVYNASEKQIEWQGLVDGLSSAVVTYGVVVEPSLTEPTVLRSVSHLSGDGQTHPITSATIVNGYQSYLPAVRKP